MLTREEPYNHPNGAMARRKMADARRLASRDIQECPGAVRPGDVSPPLAGGGRLNAPLPPDCGPDPGHLDQPPVLAGGGPPPIILKGDTWVGVLWLRWVPLLQRVGL